jgi:superfamily II DNA helicase RecQ
VQEAGLEAIMKRRLRVLVIMATGGGKRMLSMLPAAVSPHGGITIVIMPLTSL